MSTAMAASEASSVLTAVTPKPRTAATEAAEDVIYGSAAGVIGKYIEYPFDTVKVRLQAQPDHLPPLYRGPIDCFRQSIRADGFLGLYRGISAPLVGAALETSSLFLFERLGRSTLLWSGMYPHDVPLSLPALYFTGAFSGSFTSFLLTPIELIKCKIQVPGEAAAASVSVSVSSVSAAATTTTTTTVHRRPLEVIREVYRHEGIRGFWHGQMGTLIREAGGCAAWFGGKETSTLLFREYNIRHAKKQNASAATLAQLQADPLPLWQQALSGASAGMSYNFLFFPADTVKSRMQTSTSPGAGGVRRTFVDEARVLYKQAGIRGFYRGCGVTVARSAPSSAFIFMVFDGMKTHFPLA